MNFLKNPNLVKINDVLTSANHKCWLVGGAVRDFFIDRPPNDFDFATNVDPDTCMQLFTSSDIKNYPKGINHGTIVVELDNEAFEITSAHYYKNGEIIYSKNIEDDLSHRDFTINAMAMDFNGKVIDPFDGQHDLSNGIVRFVGNPIDRISEDPLRMIRFFRFDHTFRQYEETESDSYNAIVDNVSMISQVSGWRLWNELSKCLISDHSNEIMEDLRGIDMLDEIGIFSNSYFGEISGSNDPYQSFVEFLQYSDDSVLETMMKKFKWTIKQRQTSREFKASFNV